MEYAGIVLFVAVVIAVGLWMNNNGKGPFK